MIGAAEALPAPVAGLEARAWLLAWVWVRMARAHMARAFLRLAEWVDPGALDERFRTRISAVTMETVKALMDQQGLSRCQECAQRTGLIRVGNTLLCAMHRADKKDGGDRG